MSLCKIIYNSTQKKHVLHVNFFLQTTYLKLKTLKPPTTITDTGQDTPSIQIPNHMAVKCQIFQLSKMSNSSNMFLQTFWSLVFWTWNVVFETGQRGNLEREKKIKACMYYQEKKTKVKISNWMPLRYWQDSVLAKLNGKYLINICHISYSLLANILANILTILTIHLLG